MSSHISESSVEWHPWQSLDATPPSRELTYPIPMLLVVFDRAYQLPEYYVLPKNTIPNEMGRLLVHLNERSMSIRMAQTFPDLEASLRQLESIFADPSLPRPDWLSSPLDPTATMFLESALLVRIIY